MQQQFRQLSIERLIHFPIKVLSLIVLAGGLTTACDSPPPAPMPQSQPALEAMHKLRTGNLAGAVKDYSLAIAQDPKAAEHYVNRGIAYNELGQNQQAIADYNKALALKPDLVLAYYNRANAHQQLKQYKEAIADYSKIISLNSEYAYAYANRGAAYFQINQKKEAVKDVEKAIQIFTDKNDSKNVDRLQTRLRQWQASKP
jgi:tetratricopeptide (TPR) repeat protein